MRLRSFHPFRSAVCCLSAPNPLPSMPTTARLVCFQRLQRGKTIARLGTPRRCSSICCVPYGTLVHSPRGCYISSTSISHICTGVSGCPGKLVPILKLDLLKAPPTQGRPSLKQRIGCAIRMSALKQSRPSSPAIQPLLPSTIASHKKNQRQISSSGDQITKVSCPLYRYTRPAGDPPCRFGLLTQLDAYDLFLA